MTTLSRLGRRTVLAGALAVGAVGTLPAWGATQPESETLQRWLDERAGTAGPVVIESAATPLIVSGPIRIPSGMNLIMRRALRGTPVARLELTGRNTLRFEGAPARDVPLYLRAGSATITGFDYSGDLHIAAILIEGPGPFANLVIEDLHVSDANYGILRQGATSRLDGATIRRCRFRRLRGDAIEWNICPHDHGVLVEDIDIDGIDDERGRPNWGIGIGFAGRTFTRNWAIGESVSDFHIRRVRARGLRQLIHVEAGANFRVEDVTASDIDPRYSARSNMPSALVACYGCRDFTLSGLRSDSGDVLLFAGVIDAKYVNPSADFLVADVTIGRGSIRTEMGGTDAYARFRRVRLADGVVALGGAVRALELTDVDVRAPAGTAPITTNPDFLSGPLTAFRPSHPLITRIRVRARTG